MTATIREKIIADKKYEVEQKKRILPISALKTRIVLKKMPLNFYHALSGDSLKLIAEIKRASPSKGLLCPDFDPLALAKTYAGGGAAAISVLTEVNYFQGKIEHLEAVKEEVNIPVMRKDFIFDQYQIYESAACGADALLLIASVLSREQLEEMLELCRSLGLSSLVEVHNEKELEKTLLAGAGIIGINNRDLDTFTVDINTTRRIRPLIPEGRIVVSESGINSCDDMKKMKEWGVNAVLVGEALVTASNIPAKMEELLS